MSEKTREDRAMLMERVINLLSCGIYETLGEKGFLDAANSNAEARRMIDALLSAPAEATERLELEQKILHLLEDVTENPERLERAQQLAQEAIRSFNN